MVLALCAIMMNMGTITIRDVADDVTASLDAAAFAAGARSREAFLRDHLARTFGPNSSAVASTAARVRAAVEQMEALGRFLVLQPAPSLPLIARAMGHADASMLEAETRGDRPLSFSDGDRLCNLFGLDRTWLDSGTGSTPRFATRAKHHDCRQLLFDFLQNGIPYEALYFILTDGEDSVAAIIGHSASDDPAIGWRYDLLVDEIPIHTHVGDSGKAQRRECAELIAALYQDELFNDKIPLLVGQIAPYAQYVAVLSGHIHAGTITTTYAPGLSMPMTRASDWPHDFWGFNQVAHTSEYTKAHAALLEELRADGIRTNQEIMKAVAKMVGSWNIVRPRPQ